MTNCYLVWLNSRKSYDYREQDILAINRTRRPCRSDRSTGTDAARIHEIFPCTDDCPEVVQLLRVTISSSSFRYNARYSREAWEASFRRNAVEYNAHCTGIRYGEQMKSYCLQITYERLMSSVIIAAVYVVLVVDPAYG